MSNSNFDEYSSKKFNKTGIKINSIDGGTVINHDFVVLDTKEKIMLCVNKCKIAVEATGCPFIIFRYKIYKNRLTISYRCSYSTLSAATDFFNYI